eukprot:Amastigsp_a2251_82.p4 type:complete len:117 gc:universal Amastigsp_a2251_82:623-273(-)
MPSVSAASSAASRTSSLQRSATAMLLLTMSPRSAPPETASSTRSSWTHVPTGRPHLFATISSSVAPRFFSIRLCLAPRRRPQRPFRLRSTMQSPSASLRTALRSGATLSLRAEQRS